MEEQCRTGVMSLGWDPTTAQLVIEAYPLGEVEEDDDGFLADEDDESDDAEEVLRVKMPVGTARAFAKRTREVEGAGPAHLRDLRPADRRRRAHLHLPRELMLGTGPDGRAHAYRPHHDGVERQHRRRGGGLQTDRRRAAAVGLSRRLPGAPRSGRLLGVGGPGLEHLAV